MKKKQKKTKKNTKFKKRTSKTKKLKKNKKIQKKRKKVLNRKFKIKKKGKSTNRKKKIIPTKIKKIRKELTDNIYKATLILHNILFRKWLASEEKDKTRIQEKPNLREECLVKKNIQTKHFVLTKKATY